MMPRTSDVLAPQSPVPVDPSPLPLTPRLSADLADLLGARKTLLSLVDALGSPLNVLLPDAVSDTVDRFRAVYDAHHLTGEIYYAHKANRSSAVVRRLAATTARLDVASTRELQHGLGAGFAPDRVMSTGPKTLDHLWLAARTGSVVNVDSTAELVRLVGLVRAHGLAPVPVLLRLSGFTSVGTTVLTRTSRFGIDVANLGAALDLVQDGADAVDLVGVGYHLDTIGLPEKVAATEGCLLALAKCQRRGMRPRVLDVGGGFGVDYLADPAQWERWTTALTEAVLGRRPPLTWGGHGYGLRSEGGVLRGALALYPASRPLAGPAYLDALLRSPAPSLGRPLATLLLENMLELWTEPGRALLDQAGMVLGSVEEVRPGRDGRHLVRLGLNAGDVSLEEHGVLMDPVLLRRRDRPEDDGGVDAGPAGVHLLGNLCLEADLITRRVVHLPHLPQPGDVLAFVNTAGYFMDFSADAALQQPVARKVALTRDDGDRWRWCLDEQYWPTTASATTRAARAPQSTTTGGHA